MTEASPIISASPASSAGSPAVRLPRVSGSSLFTYAWSPQRPAVAQTDMQPAVHAAAMLANTEDRIRIVISSPVRPNVAVMGRALLSVNHPCLESEKRVPTNRWLCRISLPTLPHRAGLCSRLFPPHRASPISQFPSRGGIRRQGFCSWHNVAVVGRASVSVNHPCVESDKRVPTNRWFCNVFSPPPCWTRAIVPGSSLAAVATHPQFPSRGGISRRWLRSRRTSKLWVSSGARIPTSLWLAPP